LLSIFRDNTKVSHKCEIASEAKLAFIDILDTPHFVVIHHKTPQYATYGIVQVVFPTLGSILLVEDGCQV
jgi:hypothetical protein